MRGQDKRFKLIRQAVGLSVADLAKLCGISRQEVYAVENGKAEMADRHRAVFAAYVEKKCREIEGLEEIISAIVNMKQAGEDI